MTLENKCDEYSRLFLKLEREEPQTYNRIRTYCNSCMGIEKPDYNSIPKLDKQYLEIELQQLINRKPEYNNIGYELFRRITEFVK